MKRMSHCPHDQELLASNDVSGYRYYSCERCNDDWIPGAMLDRALSARGVQELRAIPSSGRSKLNCPDCQTTLATLIVDGCTLDSCERCRGIWLDAGEALRVRRLFPEDSAVVDAEREAGPANRGWAAVSLVDCVANLILLIGK
jgi:Zn-finger nucleic acid-binding protein